MQIHYSLSSFQLKTPTVVTSGTFDGVHFGHQKILNRLNELGRQANLKSLVITFWPHPRFVLNKDGADLKLLNTLEEKIKLFEGLGIDHLLVVPFTPEFAKLTSEEFIRQVLIEKANTKKLVIGYDHRFGRNREGTFEYLRDHAGKFGFEVEEISAQELDEVAVSSTKIREALSNGKPEIAQKYLTYPYKLTGVVVKGEQLGQKIGFPTANIHIPEANKLIPKEGTYAVEVRYKEKRYMGMLNIGKRPTVSSGLPRTIEVHLLNFEENIYGEQLSVFFLKMLRDEKKFDSLEELKKQLALDKMQTEEVGRTVWNKSGIRYNL